MLPFLKNEQAFVEGCIAEIEEIKRKAKVVVPGKSTSHAVSVGCTVELEVEGGAETYMIVGATEANPIGGKISAESPTGKALLGHGKGDKVVVHAPSGKIEYLIKSVRF